MYISLSSSITLTVSLVEQGCKESDNDSALPANETRRLQTDRPETIANFVIFGGIIRLRS